jgi:hypothetical protein
VKKSHVFEQHKQFREGHKNMEGDEMFITSFDIKGIVHF